MRLAWRTRGIRRMLLCDSSSFCCCCCCCCYYSLVPARMISTRARGERLSWSFKYGQAIPHRIMLLHTLQVTAEVATLRLLRSSLASLLLPSRCGIPSGQRIPCYMGPERGTGAPFIGYFSKYLFTSRA